MSFCVFVENSTNINFPVFDLWLAGLSVQEAAAVRQKIGILQKTGATLQILKHDIWNHYRTFTMLEHYVHAPTRLYNQLVFQLDNGTMQTLIEKYYEFDKTVARELLGKKLTSKQRKDIDDVSEKTGISVRSCRRQFDTLRRVIRTIEDTDGALIPTIQHHFLLSDSLAKKYAAIVFLADNRFELTKKKLNYVMFDDFVVCADEIMTKWTTTGNQGDQKDLDFDREFLQELRELKILFSDKDIGDKHKMIVLSTIEGKVSEHIIVDLEQNFKNISRYILNIGACLIHTKDMRDFFVDIVEKIIEPNKTARWSNSDTNTFLNAYYQTSLQLVPVQRQPKMYSTLERYMTTLTKCIMQMYHS